MSLSAKSKTRVKQLLTGIHLVMIDDLWLTKDGHGNILTTTGGQVPMSIRFTDSNGYSFDNNYLLKGDKEFIFHKMCTAFGIDYTVTKLKDECGIDVVKADGTVVKATKPRKRGYIFIREVHDVDGTEIVKDEVTGVDVVNYYIFDYAPFMAGQKAPTRLGCPVDGKGADGDFIDYRQISSIEQQVHKQKLSKAERLELGKKVIADTKAKKEDVFTLEEEFVEPVVEEENAPAFDTPALVKEVKSALFPNEEFLNQPESPIFGQEEKVIDESSEESPQLFIEEDLFAETTPKETTKTEVKPNTEEEPWALE